MARQSYVVRTMKRKDNRSKYVLSSKLYKSSYSGPSYTNSYYNYSRTVSMKQVNYNY